MDWVVSAAGAAVVAFVLQDIFHTLWHPSGQGRLTMALMSTTWRLARRRRHGRGELAGPLGMVAVFGGWTLITTVGWALIYWPHMPERFIFGSGLEPAARDALLDSLYLSLVTLGTLGFGDVVPEVAWLRLALPVQALMGFALLTAVVTWILQIYPALGRRRALASRLSLLQRADAAETLLDLDPQVATRLLQDVTDGLIDVTVDLMQYTETYYFGDAVARTSLAATAGYALELAGTADGSDCPEVRLSGEVLRCALEDFTGVLQRKFLTKAPGSVRETLRAFAADHGQARAS